MLVKKVVIIAIVLFISCNEKESNNKDFYHIINHHFFQIVDSSAYISGKLIQVPFQEEEITNDQKICISFDYISILSNRMEISISAIVQKLENKYFQNLISKKYSLELKIIDLLEIKNIGRFELHQLNEKTNNNCINFAGKLTLYRPFISSDLAIVPYSISRSEKAGYSRIMFLEKIDGSWQKNQTIEIERW